MDTRPHASPAFFDAVASDLKPVAVTRWTAQLADPECERDFRRYRLADDRRRAIILLLLVSVASAFNFLIELTRYIESGTEFLPGLRFA